jgi:thymidylate kinase
MKPKIIEIIGPPGVGKSTIYQSLCRTRKPGSHWVYPDVLLTSKPGFFSFRKWLVYQLRMLQGKKLTKSIPVDYGLRFADQHHELAEFCWSLLSDAPFNRDKEIGKRFRSVYFLFTTFCTYQAIAEKCPPIPCIIEEGLLQKSFFIRDDEEDHQLINELLNKYLLLVPLPYAVIYIDTPDIKEIVKRLRGRNKIIASHLDKDDAALRRDIEKWQYTYHYILERLKNAGVLIVRLNGIQPVQENVSRIKELMENEFYS